MKMTLIKKDALLNELKKITIPQMEPFTKIRDAICNAEEVPAIPIADIKAFRSILESSSVIGNENAIDAIDLLIKLWNLGHTYSRLTINANEITSVMQKGDVKSTFIQNTEGYVIKNEKVDE